MKIEIVGYDLRALRTFLAKDSVQTVRFETNTTGLAMKINEGIWEPIGKVIKADESPRFPYVGGAKVLASFYDQAADRFVILADRGHGVHPFVVAYARNLTDAEWDSGRYLADYRAALTVWRERINEIVNAAT